ncbi:ATP10 protein-domain-containing protein [Sparassis latifolia]
MIIPQIFRPAFSPVLRAGTSSVHQKAPATRFISVSCPRRSAEPPQSIGNAAEAKSTANVEGKGKERATEATGKNEGDEMAFSLPLLQRPLGVRGRPTSLVKTWAQTREELMDQEMRMQKRNHLVKEATKGYFADLNATRRHGGKTWIAPRVMIREDKALYFPDISGTTLDNNTQAHTTHLCTGKVSIIAMLSSKISEIQTANFIDAAHAQYSSHPAYQYIQINLQENLLKSLLVSLFTSGIRKNVPQERWGKYLVSSQNMEYIRDDLGMTNRHVGYVYLVDEKCRIRWAGCADPKPEESEALKVCTNVLLDRHSKQKEELLVPSV